MLSHKGTKEIKTERLILRKFIIDDCEDMFVWASNPEVTKYLAYNSHKTIEDSKNIISFWISKYENADTYNWAIEYKGKVIGNIEVVEQKNAECHLGWQIDKQYWNKGIMTEAATAVLNYLFCVGYECISSAHDAENIGSGRVMQKIGMTKYQTIPDFVFDKDGRIIEKVCCKISKSEWLSMNTKQIDISEFEKCNNIWDIKNCPFTEQFKDELISGNRETYVLEINNQFIAEASLVFYHSENGCTIPNKRLYLSRLIVKKEYRNRGIGKAMLDYMIAKAKDLGYEEISIGVDNNNLSAIHIYENAGFKVFENAEDKYGKYYKMLLSIN